MFTVERAASREFPEVGNDPPEDLAEIIGGLIWAKIDGRGEGGGGVGTRPFCWRHEAEGEKPVRTEVREGAVEFGARGGAAEREEAHESRGRIALIG